MGDFYFRSVEECRTHKDHQDEEDQVGEQRQPGAENFP